MEATFNGETDYGSAPILGILLQRNVAAAMSVAPTKALDAFHAHEQAQGREIGVGHEQVLQKRERSVYIDLWTATGIRMKPNQQIVAKSLAACWNMIAFFS